MSDSSNCGFHKIARIVDLIESSTQQIGHDEYTQRFLWKAKLGYAPQLVLSVPFGPTSHTQGVVQILRNASKEVGGRG